MLQHDDPPAHGSRLAPVRALRRRVCVGPQRRHLPDGQLQHPRVSLQRVSQREVGDVGDAGLDLGIITKKLRVTKDKLVTLGGIKTIGAEADLLRSQIGEFRSQRRRILDERIRQERSKKVMGLVFKTAQTPATTLRPA